jgi:hypothetical protein
VSRNLPRPHLIIHQKKTLSTSMSDNTWKDGHFTFMPRLSPSHASLVWHQSRWTLSRHQDGQYAISRLSYRFPRLHFKRI